MNDMRGPTRTARKVSAAKKTATTANPAKKTAAKKAPAKKTSARKTAAKKAPSPKMCVWCGKEQPEPVPLQCSQCGLTPSPESNPKDHTPPAETETGAVPAAKKTVARNRRGAPKIGELGTKPLGKPVIGVDPGARYTGVVVRDGDVPLYAATLVRSDDTTATDWAIHVTQEIRKVCDMYPNAPMGVEGVSDPKGFQFGKRSPINPRDLVRAGIVLGAVVGVWTDAHIIPPGGNGSQHQSHYPPQLIGRRPKTLPGASNGAGTRDHEQSAYDVAGKAAKHFHKNPPPDYHDQM